MDRIQYLDYARFFAILGVIVVHVGTNSSFYYFIPNNISNLGRFGVQLFFIVSGVTIFLSYENLKRKTFNPIKPFYIKRFFRIVPLFIVMGFYYSIYNNIAVYKILYPWSGLDPRQINSIAGGWSIWNEMYFYLLFPAYLYFRKNNFRIFLLSLILLFLSNIIHFRFFNLGSDINMMDFDYLNIFSQFICFVFGIEYIAKDYKKIFIFFMSFLIIGVTIKLVFFRDFIFVADYGSTYFLAIISALCLAFIHLLKQLFKKKSENIFLKIISECGKTTYTSYMIHFIVIDIIFKNKLFDYGIEINVIIVSILVFSISYLIKPFTENLSSDLGYKISKKFI